MAVMEFLKIQVARVQQQLAGLTPSQRMLAGALVVIMVMTLLYSARYAGTAEMEPLLDQSLGADDIANISMKLDGMGIPKKVVGDKVMVPADRKYEVLALLAYDQKLPGDTSKGFAELVKGINMFSTASITDAQLNDAKAVTLSNVIKRFPGVRDATVMIDPTSKRRITETYAATASVYISTKHPTGRANKQLVEAAAAVVAGAQAGLARKNVTVVVDGVTRKLEDDGSVDADGGLGSTEMLERVQAYERYLTQKIAEQISFIPDPKISVTVELDNRATKERKQEYDPKKTFTKDVESESRTEESNSAGQPSNDPGAVPNTGMAIGGPGAGGTTSTTTEEKTKSTAFPSMREEQVVTPAGKPTVVAATVRVPQSYFAAVWMRKNPGGKEPTDDVIRTMADAELPKIRTDVMNCTGLKDEKLVSVETYADTLPLMAGADGGATASASGASSLPLGIAGYGKEIAIGVLAVVSLFMVTTMVKKGTPSPVVLGPLESPGPVTLASGEVVAGEAVGGGQTLDGMELDEDSVRAEQMLDQVTTMVKENPDGAAAMVKRWMNRT
jgi:flagellar biosynthesis/type III secretory pathway M-ring protein FliF/YscJ